MSQVQVQQVVQALQAAQEQVLALAQEQVRVLGLAVAQVEALVVVQPVRAPVSALVEVEALVEVLEPVQDQEWPGPGPLVEL